MTGFVGMDSGEIRRLAGSLRVQAGHVGTVVGAIDGLVSQSLSHWHGADAVDFAHAWTSTFRPRLLALRGWLDEMAHAAVTNADEQDRTSGAGDAMAGAGGASATTSSESGPKSVWDAALSGVAGVGGFLLGKAALFSGNAFSTGRYTAGWDKVIAWGDGRGIPTDLLRFKRSPVFQMLNRQHGFLDFASHAADTVSIAGDAIDAFYDFRDGYALDGVGDVLDGAGSGLGFAKTTPVTFLGGIALHAWADVAHHAADVDWSYMSETNAYAMSHPGEVVDSFKDAAVQVFGHDMWTWL